jgi:hypothetical protein
MHTFMCRGGSLLCFEQTIPGVQVAPLTLRRQTDKARAELAKTEGKFEQYRKDAGNEAMKKIDEADRKIEEGAAKAKGGISSWFGGK